MDTVELTITEAEMTPFAVLGYIRGGTFGVGEFSASGRRSTVNHGRVDALDGHECLLFSGTIVLAYGPGAKGNVETSFALQLDIDLTTGSANGVYHVGPPDDRMFEQYGIVRLSTQFS